MKRETSVLPARDTRNTRDPLVPVVTCENLVKIYQVREANIEVMALQGLDLELRRGEMLTIVGESGSGKTTLLNILGALDLPSAGRCTVAGCDLTRLREHELNEYRRFIVGHIWQQSGRNLTADLTLLENVSLPQLLAGVGRRERDARSHDLLALVGLEAHERRRPDELSGGEQQRGAIAVALANAPAILLADEPTGELDSGTAHAIITLLYRLTRALDLAVILVTHDPAAAAEADRTIAIRDGRTSTETVRRNQSLASSGTSAASAPAIASDDRPTRDATSALDAPLAGTGLPYGTHEESLVIDRSGWLQLPAEAIERIAFAGRAELHIALDHVEIWPVGMLESASALPVTAGIGLPADHYREAVVLDHAGRLQLSEDALDHVPFGRHAVARIAHDHVELWPRGK